MMARPFAMMPHRSRHHIFARFESSFNSAGHPPGWVAQLVEQRTENPCVGGSIPPPATISQCPLGRMRLGFTCWIPGLWPVLTYLHYRVVGVFGLPEKHHYERLRADNPDYSPPHQ